MIKTILQRLKGSRKSLIATDLLFKVVAFVLLIPFVGLLFRVFLSASGRTILADIDIARFLLHPTGWLAIIVVGSVAVAVLALEQSALMAISLAAVHGKSLTAIGALRFVASKAHGVVRIAASMVARLLLLATPFLALGGAAYLLLLTDRDINFYLAHKPPRFWTAVCIIGGVLSVLFVLVVRCIVNWSVAMQVHLFEGLPASACLAVSRTRVFGHRRKLVKWVISWWVLNAILGASVAYCVVEMARLIVPRFTASLSQLAIVLGISVMIWMVVNLICNLLAVISLALLQSLIYERCGQGETFRPPGSDETAASLFPKMTPMRIAVALAVAVVAATLIGALAIRGVRLEDHVAITAHRAGAGRAPENTMAAVHQAIEDGADWIEIDVQESSDGVVVVVHDSDLARIGGFDGKIWATTAEQLRSHDIGSHFSPEFSSERVPTLAEVLDACRGKVRVNIELKYYGHDVELVPKVIALVEERDMDGEIVLMSLELDQVQRAKQLRPDWRVGLLTAVAAGDLTRADADFLAVNAKLATPAFVQRAHSRQRDVHVWTINDAVGMSTMISRGVDNIITDRPDIARQVLNERAELSPTDRVLIELAYSFGIVPRGSENLTTNH